MLSVVIPVYNEQDSVQETLRSVHDELASFGPSEIIVVNDGSTDDTLARIKASPVPDVRLIHHVENLGYGRSLFDGIREAKYEVVAIIDGDGSYPASQIRNLFSYYPDYDMVVGARSGPEYRRGFLKRPARILFKMLVEYAAGREVPDVNSGLRVFRKDVVMQFRHSLCTGFSFTTTLTLIFLLNHYFVKYVPIEYHKRTGKSKIDHFRDTLRALQIIVEAFLFYNPVKLFLLIALADGLLGVVLWIASLVVRVPLLEMAAALCVASVIPLFALGLIANQLKRLAILSQGVSRENRSRVSDLDGGSGGVRADREDPELAASPGNPVPGGGRPEARP